MRHGGRVAGGWCAVAGAMAGRWCVVAGAMVGRWCATAGAMVGIDDGTGRTGLVARRWWVGMGVAEDGGCRGWGL